jgi:adenine-specific DNA-methyltransferase
LACSQPGDVIFDPFIGSGTVAEVAIRTGRKVIGFEIDDSYIGIIKERVKTLRHKLAEESRQQSLFVETRPSLA